MIYFQIHLDILRISEALTAHKIIVNTYCSKKSSNRRCIIWTDQDTEKNNYKCMKIKSHQASSLSFPSYNGAKNFSVSKTRQSHRKFHSFRITNHFQSQQTHFCLNFSQLVLGNCKPCVTHVCHRWWTLLWAFLCLVPRRNKILFFKLARFRTWYIPYSRTSVPF